MLAAAVVIAAVLSFGRWQRNVGCSRQGTVAFIASVITVIVAVTLPNLVQTVSIVTSQLVSTARTPGLIRQVPTIVLFVAFPPLVYTLAVGAAKLC